MKKLQIAITAILSIVIVFISALGLRKVSDTEDYISKCELGIQL